MKKDAKTYLLGEKGSVLFSGGSDSTLAAYLLGQQVRHVTLLTFDPGYNFFVENSARHVGILKEALGDDRVTHRIIPIRDEIKAILGGDLKNDLRTYGFNMTALVCLGCRMTMHATAIIYNLENEIPVIVDGSIKKQADIPEQLASFIRRNRKRLWRRYGIRHYSPIYYEGQSDRRLDNLHISFKKALKRQFILFDSQPTCVFGVPADVYARLFYGKLSGPAREVDAYTYSEEKYPAIDRLLESHFEGRDPDLPMLIRQLEELSSGLPDQWEDLELV